MIALFAALIGPWFIDWNDYKANFEAEAGKILGRPVHVLGSASATLLPSPSLTFEDVKVGEAEGQPMMTVDRFEVTIDLTPLLQGEFRVVSMRLDGPRMRVVVGENGRVDWQSRNEASKTLDPDKVILQNVTIADGHIDYVDAVSGRSLAFEKVNASVEAQSLYGPWRVDGSYLQKGVAVPFRFATGRRLDDGTIRVRSDVSPAGWPVSVVADGVLGSDDAGFYYDGTYNVAEVVTPPPGDPVAAASAAPAATTAPATTPTPATATATGWRSEGTFRLSSDELAIAKAVLSGGPPDRPYSVAGSLTVDLGAQPKFEARVTSRQIDLDRSLGEGPTKPVDVSSAAKSLVAWLKNSFIPPIPGSLFFSVPGIVVGGAVIQNVDFEARPALGGWRVAHFDATLPGAGRLQLRGLLATDFDVDFRGDIRLAVDQPTAFATWWRGQSQGGSARLLQPFDLAGRAEISKGSILLENIDGDIGDASLRGRVAWSDVLGRQPQRMIETEIDAATVDFNQLRALGELVVGEGFVHSGAIADSYALKLTAETVRFEEMTVEDVAVDAGFAGDALTVNEFSIGNLGGANFNITQGRIEGLTTQPRGRLDAQLEADTLSGVITLAERLFPDHPLTRRLSAAGDSLSPAFLTASIEAPPVSARSDFRVTLNGNLAATTLSAILDLSGNPASWRQGQAAADIIISSQDAVEFARQAGIEGLASAASGAARVEVKAAGVPANGLELKISGDLAGLGIRSSGKLVLAPQAPPAFTGSVAAAADDVRPLMRMLDLEPPGLEARLPVRFDGAFDTAGKRVALTLKNSRIGEHVVSGRAALAPAETGAWQIDGDINVDAAAFSWLAGLGLGTGLIAESDGAWSRAPFNARRIGDIAGSLRLSVGRLALAEGFDATAAQLVLDLQPDRTGIRLTGAQFKDGSLAGELAIHNVEGSANISGRVDLKGAALESFVWRRSGRAVATGTLDLSAEFEGAGHSPAAMASSLTGGGTIAIRNGEARYVNPQVAELIIRAADLDQEFSEAELVQAVTRQIDGGSLKFDSAEGAFAIAAGVARIKSLIVESGAARASGNAAIDLAGSTLDSDWTLAFPPVDDRVKGTAPTIGVIFRGPLAAPERTIDVLQFGSYLNIRQEERLLEMLNQAEADRLERDRLNRERRKLREDAERRARDEAARIAAEIERLRVAALLGSRAAMSDAARTAAEQEQARVAAGQQRRRAAALHAMKSAEMQAAAATAGQEAGRVLAGEQALRAAALAAMLKAAPEAAGIALNQEQDRLAVEAEKRRKAAVTFGRRVAVAASSAVASQEVARVAEDRMRRRDVALADMRMAGAAAGRVALLTEVERLEALKRQRRASSLPLLRAAAGGAARVAARGEQDRIATEAAARRDRAILALAPAAGDGARDAAQSEARRAAEAATARMVRAIHALETAAAVASRAALAAEGDRLAQLAAERLAAALEDAKAAMRGGAKLAAVEEIDRIAAMLAALERERQQEVQRAEAAERAREIAVKAASSAAEAAGNPVDEVPAIMLQVAPLQPAAVP